MKPMLLLLCTCCVANCITQKLSAQTIHSLPNSAIASDSGFRIKRFILKSKPDTVIDKNRLPYNGMPNAFITKTPPDVYVGNNGQGQDIYRSHVDNMAILKPDSSFQSGMFTGNYLPPNKSYSEVQPGAPVWIKPKPQLKTPKKN